eukprot:155434_1
MSARYITLYGATISLILVSNFARIGCQHLPLADLKYDYDALEPYISEAVMRVHHMGHYTAYNTKLNSALAELRMNPETKSLAKMGIDRLLENLSKIPESDGLRERVTNNGGGYVNHEFFFESMSPSKSKGGIGGEPPIGELLSSIGSTFGSLEMFQEQFSAAAANIFGSGWAWLIFDRTDSALKIITSVNQNGPPMDEMQDPLLALDVWEHAYYLQYQNNRSEYIENFWNIVNWKIVEKRFESTKKARLEL